jgi:hypothetical protein
MVMTYLQTDDHMPQLKLTADILSAALDGYEAEKKRIDARIAEIKQQLHGGRPAPAGPDDAGRPRKKRSVAVRRKMALAQRARYAKLKQVAEPLQAAAATPKKRKLSAAGRQAIIAATKKRWAAVKAARQAERPAVPKKAGRKLPN